MTEYESGFWDGVTIIGFMWIFAICIVSSLKKR